MDKLRYLRHKVYKDVYLYMYGANAPAAGVMAGGSKSFAAMSYTAHAEEWPETLAANADQIIKHTHCKRIKTPDGYEGNVYKQLELRVGDFEVVTMEEGGNDA